MLNDDTLSGLLAGLTATHRCTTLADALDGLTIKALARLAGGRMTWRGYLATMDRLRALWARDYA